VTGTLSALGAIANIELPLSLLPILFLYFVLAYLLFAGLYAVIGAISNSMREGPQYAVIFTLPAALPFYFISVFSSTPDAALPVIMSLFPLTAPIAMTLRLLVAPVPAGQIALSLGLLALGVVAAIWAAGRAFRVQVLLAGQPPKFRELGKLLR